MSLNATPTLRDVRTRLAHALGYDDYPANATAEPYLTYIYKRHIGTGALEEWLELFIEVVEYFDTGLKGSSGNNTIQALIDRLAASGFLNLFMDTSAGQAARILHVEDTVMYILGTWSTMLTSFVQQRNQSRKVIAAYRMCSDPVVTLIEPYENDLAGLVQGCELLPNGRWDRRHDFGRDTAMKLIMMMLSNSSNAPASPMHMSFQSICPQASQSKLTSSRGKRSLICTSIFLSTVRRHRCARVSVDQSHQTECFYVECLECSTSDLDAEYSSTPVAHQIWRST